MGAHVPRDGEFALHADCEEFDSLCLHQILYGAFSLTGKTMIMRSRECSSSLHSSTI